MSPNAPLNFIVTLSLESSLGKLAHRNVLGVPSISTPRSSFASTSPNSSIDSEVPAGLIASSLDTRERCVLPLARVLTFVLPFLF